jgi:pimeloyl-ACP methyl ester carboxylesterase
LNEFFTEIWGHRIRYIKSKDGGNPIAVLFIHGLGSAADRWMDLPEAISFYFDAYALDLIGFGKSDKPTSLSYNILEFVEFLREFIRKELIKYGEIILVGHSLGGYIACEFVIKYPTLVRKLVLVDSSGMLDKPTPLLAEYLDVAMNPSYDKVMSIFRKMLGNPLFVSPLVTEIFINNISNEPAKNAFRKTLENSANTQIRHERLQKIKIPTLIIWGVEDRVIPMEHAEIFRKNIVGSKLVKIERAGHAPFVEKPSVVFDLIRRFLVDSP